MPYTRHSARRTKWITSPVLLTVLIGLTIFPGASSSRHTFRPGPSAPDTHGEIRSKAPTQTRQATIRTGLNFKTALAPATLSSLAPIADAYVSSTATSSNFGTLTVLQSRRSTLESYLTFNLTSLGTESVISAKLRLTGGLNDASGTNVATQVFSVSSTSWTETGILWSNKPSSGSTALASVTVTDNVSRLYEWDVTAFVKAEINAERNLVSLALKNPSTSTPYATFNSREAISNPPELVVTTTPPPTVSITNPASGASLIAPATITIDADASDADGIMKVEFLQGSTVLATDTTFPYSFTWNNVAVGNYTLTARATDTLGAVTTSAPVNVSVVLTFPPTVIITSPATGATFPSPAAITITANASDTDGVSKVDFYQGNTLLGTATSVPYSFTWTGMPACTYFLTAKATDSLGAVATSVPVMVKVTGGTIGESTPPNFKIAFLADQGLGPLQVATLNLIVSEGAQALVMPGDLDYADNPAAWDAQLNNTVGPNFPVFTVSGNHDEDVWHGPTGYQKVIEARFNRLGIPWCGSCGVQQSFHYKGIFFVFTTPGLDPIVDLGNNDTYIRDQLAADRSIWSISSWHKNMHLMQAGGKDDETGWEVYEESRAGGAIIANGHEHSYFRTHLLSSMMNQTVASTSNTLNLTKGNSFVFVSGLGGQSRREQEVTGPWVSRISAAICLPGDPICQSNAVEGAMFGVFNVDGQQNKANFYFKDVNGQIIDSFTVISHVDMPAITSIAPSQVSAGGAGFTLTVNGSSFINESRVQLNGLARPTTFVSSTQLTAEIIAEDILAGGTSAIKVFNAVTGGGISNQVDLAVNNPLPSITSISPSAFPVCGGEFTLTINGTNFVPSSVMTHHGYTHETNFVSSTQLTAHILEADFETLAVFNPAPGGGMSNTVGMGIPNPVPSISNLSPSSAVAGGGPFILTVNGGAFCANAVVRFNGSDRTTTFVNETQLTAEISAADIQTAGTFSISVFRPAPGGGTSNAVGFTVMSSTVDVLSISPDNAVAGGPGFTLTVTGNNFFDGVVVRWNGSDRPTTVVNPTQLTAQISATDISQQNNQTSGTAEVTVFVPGGGISAPFTFTISCACGYEGDVAPRPSGSNNGVISISDWVQMGRFASGLDTITNFGCEFQRADCAPRITRGGGTITISDWVQAGRYAAGLDSPLCAGGPTEPPEGSTELPTVSSKVTASAVSEASVNEAKGAARFIKLTDTRLSADKNLRISIELDSQTDENAIGLSLNFIPAQLSFVSASKGRDAQDGTLAINSDHVATGSLGIALALPPGQSFRAGSRKLVVLTFKSSMRRGHPVINFGDQPVRRELVDLNARELGAHFIPLVLSGDDRNKTINPIDEARFFVNQNYLDVLRRFPDTEGLDYWTKQITLCGSDQACIENRRIAVSAAFFIEREFKETGFFIYLLYANSLGRKPTYSEFISERLGAADIPTLETNKARLVADWTMREGFLRLYPLSLSPTEFVNRLFDTASLHPYVAERQHQIGAMTDHRKTRAEVLRDVFEISELKDREYDPAFIRMQYFAYLQRDPDIGGESFWLKVLKTKPEGDQNRYRSMICAFITSKEYQLRFSSVITRSDAMCGPLALEGADLSRLWPARPVAAFRGLSYSKIPRKDPRGNSC